MARNDDARQNGDIGEKMVLKVLERKAPCTHNEFRGNNQYAGGGWRNECYWYDIEMRIGKQTRWFEVKLDMQTKLHNNVAVETHCDAYSNGEFVPSGINMSKAEYWFFVTPEGRYWFIDLYTLRKIAFGDEQISYITEHGDACTRGVMDKRGVHEDDSRVTTLLKVIPIPLLEKYCIAYGSNIEDFNLNLIL